MHAIPEPLASTITIANPPEARSKTPIKLVFETDDLESVSAHLIAKGAVAPERHRPSFRDLLNPEGNVIQLTAS